ncbi:intraflagellar transport protein 140 homolog isoform X2 [Nematostella vectensis]|nr:intraflagellar transport protein 140 homolog isoform X2 [Nematostella vectensis]
MAILQPPAENNFYLGTTDGNVYHIDDRGKCFQRFTVEGPVKTLLYAEGRDMLVAVTDGLMLSQHTIAKDGSTTETIKVKLSGQASKSHLIWAGRQLLATATGENIVRMWNLEQDDNYFLSLKGQGFEPGECINCISYNKSKDLLAGCTSKGKVAMWKHASPKGKGRKEEGEEMWELQPPSILEGEADLTQIEWASSKNILAVNCIATVIILNEQVMKAHFNQQVAAVQVSPSQLTIENFSTAYHQDLKTDIHIKGVFVTKSHTTIWNGKRVVTYEVSPDKAMVRAEGSFSSDSPVVVVYEQSVFTAEPGKVQARTFQGTVKQILPFSEAEGDPVLLDLCGNFLVAGTSQGYVKCWDVSRREAKQHCTPKNLTEVIANLGRLKCVKCNSSGSKISIICDQENNTPDSRLYVWDCESDALHTFDFATGANSEAGDPDSSDLRGQHVAEIAGRRPVAQYWDPTEPKLLVCETLRGGDSSKTPKRSMSLLSDDKDSAQGEVMIVSLFATPEHGILLQDNFPIDASHTSLMGVEVPFFYLMNKGGTDTSEKAPLPVMHGAVSPPPLPHRRMVTKHTMRDFTGLENANDEAKRAMMDFSYLSAIGNMDEAFKAIKLIKSESVWENMARMCVKTKRLDVATVCLGNMRNARAAKALRESADEPELDARVAVLALQLGMKDEAEKLYKNSQRFDLLNQLYQASNQWTKAIEVAELHDRIHLRTTYYNYAKHLESMGNMSAAIVNYEKSDTHRFEVPRMLLDDPHQLEAYILKTKDKELRKWWAQYMESTSEMETALQFYEAARDNLSLVRVYCYCGNLEKAAEICNETGDRAACYHLARQFENQDNVKDAIHFYTRAHCYSNAIRLAKEHGLDNELMNLALLSTQQDMIDVARYYESQPNMQDKAVMLYHKGGNISKALELCFATQQFAALQVVAEDLDEHTDPVMIDKCSAFFMDHGQYDRAVDLLVVGKKFSDALDLCMRHNVVITEELGEKMTLPKGAENRVTMLERIAECAMHQGSYHLATKKYTQAGNKMKAMKALLKSGDTEKIVFFAGVSRQREIYVMAANYLQSLDWRKDPEVMKNIIGFYTKGRALDSLAGFYDACAQVEIDEYQNYDKALGALTEAYKCMAKAKMKNSTDQEEKVAFLKQRIGFVKKFVQARRSYEEDPEESVKLCHILLEEPDLETAVRVGDIYGLIIEHYARQQNFSKAYTVMEDMRQRVPSVNMAYYVNLKTIEAIHNAVGVPMGRGMGAEKPHKGGLDEDDGEEVEEEVEEDIYNGHDGY